MLYQACQKGLKGSMGADMHKHVAHEPCMRALYITCCRVRAVHLPQAAMVMSVQCTDQSPTELLQTSWSLSALAVVHCSRLPTPHSARDLPNMPAHAAVQGARHQGWSGARAWVRRGSVLSGLPCSSGSQDLVHPASFLGMFIVHGYTVMVLQAAANDCTIRYRVAPPRWPHLENTFARRSEANAVLR